MHYAKELAETAPSSRTLPFSLLAYLSDVYTVMANLTGLPAISIPCGFNSTGLPIGLQLTTKAFSEDLLLRIAQMFEQATDYHLQKPPLAGSE